MLRLFALGIAASACGGADQTPVSVTPRKADGAPVVSREAPWLEASAKQTRQAGAFSVTVHGVGLHEGLLTMSGHSYRLSPFPGGLLAAVGVEIEEAPGLAPLIAEFSDDYGDSHRLASTITIVPHEFAVDNVTLPPGAAARLDPALVAQEERIIQTTLRTFTPAFDTAWARFVRPVAGPITTYFGDARVYNGNTESRSYHRGMDIGADEEEPVAASGDGVVAFAGEVVTRGNYVIIDHGLGLFTGYGHHATLRVSKGQRVSTGDVIGLVGSTGLSTGPHLHWEAMAQGVFFDPQELLDRRLIGSGLDGSARQRA